MRIKSVECVRVNLPESEGPRTEPRRPSWAEDAEVANPMSKFPRFKRHRSSWLPAWENVWVKVTAEDGTFGLGLTSFGRVTAAIIEDHFAKHLVGEDCLAIDKCYDLMTRMSKPYGTVGLASAAISGVDLALWDLAGKLLNQPVYSLLGGPARDKVFAYATGNDTDWQLELGFKAVKLACPYGPADGVWGVNENEMFVANTRELVGHEVEIMLDCYMAFDVEYTVRLIERLRPDGLKWIEEYLVPEDLDGHAAVRKRVPWATLATGEHMYGVEPFAWLVRRRAVDILQPDMHWVGGLTPCRRICEMADAAGMMVCLHGGGMNPFGLHLTAAMPNTPWAEYGVWSPPGVPLVEAKSLPGASAPVDGWLTPNGGPGFGLGIEEEWLSAW